MPSTAQSSATENVVTLRGSTDVVAEFFFDSVNSVLYQRGVYPPESFARTVKYGIPMLITEDEGLKKYLDSVSAQLKTWLLESELQRLVLVIVGTDSGETLERWTFNVHREERPVLTDGSNNPSTEAPRKSMKKIQGEIRDIIRQITASVTFLPVLSEPCAFDLLVYANTDAKVPTEWEESDPKHIKDSSEVRLRSFTTKVHKVDTMVAYKNNSDDL